jgi:hypothetical protein
MLGGWAYSGAVYASSAERTAALDGWLWHYNHRRRHQAIGRQTPITRLNNLLGSYTPTASSCSATRHRDAEAGAGAMVSATTRSPAGCRLSSASATPGPIA